MQILYVGLAYGVLLATTAPVSAIPAWWLVGMGTLLVGAMVIMVMRARVELLIARLYDAARTDPLTKLSNRRGFREQLDLELGRARRHGSAMAVLVGDLDDFKDVNDHSRPPCRRSRAATRGKPAVRGQALNRHRCTGREARSSR